jgi:hypothetical protein
MHHVSPRGPSEKPIVHCFDPSKCDGDHPEGTIVTGPGPVDRIEPPALDPHRLHYCSVCEKEVFTVTHPEVITVAVDGVPLFKHSSGRRF